LTTSTTATPSSPAGTYSIIPAATGANLGNYNIVYVNGTLTVDKATLTVTPNNQSIVSGSVLPTLSSTITGYVNGDTQSAVTGQASLTTTGTSSSPAGSYPITASLGTLAAANYSFTFGTGILTITPAAANPGVGFAGKAMAGTQPIVGAAVQLYAAGTSGNGTAGSGLLTNTLVTDGAGAFTVPAGYACPAASSQLYVVVRGASGANPAVVLTAPVGACNQLASGSQFVINEVTTAATAYGVAQFLSPGGNIGASASNSKGLSNAVGTVASLANLTTGASPGASFPANGSSPAARINSVANLLNTCTSASSASGCTALFSATTPSGGTAPNNTLDAALNLARNPGSNVGALYTQSTASTAFTPALTAAPSDWTMFINYTGGGMNLPTGVAADATGNIWVSSYNSAVSEFSPAGAPIFPNGISGGGLLHSYGLAIDAQNNVWVPNEDSSLSVNGGYGSVTVLNSSGQLTSPPTGYIDGGIAYPIGIAIDTNASAWVIDYWNQHLTLLSRTGQPLSGAEGYATDLSFPLSIAIDANNNAWVGNSKTNTVTKVSPDGHFTSYGCCNWAGGIAIDQRGYVWVANYMGDSISQLASDGTVISPPTGYSDGKASILHPQGIAVDGSGHVWVTNILGTSITELAGSAASSPGQILSPTAGWARDAGFNYGWAVAIDASGNLWVVNHTTNLLTEVVGLATPVKTPQVGPVQSP
jgi:sugar lactone lactonase YvrE